MPIDFNGFVADRLELHRARAESQRAEIIFELSPLAGLVSVDRDRLGQVLDNLVTNALEALPTERGRVKITTAAMDDGPHRVALTVTDTGVGIPPSEINRLFEPFYTTKDNGTGLGLFLAAEIVRAHGGEITMESQPGTGTTVQVTLSC